MQREIPSVSDYAHWGEDARAVWWEENKYDMYNDGADWDIDPEDAYIMRDMMSDTNNQTGKPCTCKDITEPGHESLDGIIYCGMCDGIRWDEM